MSLNLLLQAVDFCAFALSPLAGSSLRAPSVRASTRAHHARTQKQ